MKKNNETVVFTNIGSRDTHSVIDDLEMIGINEIVRVTKDTVEVKITDRIDFISKMLANRDFV